MDPIDPRTITAADWSFIGGLVRYLWIIVILNIAFAISLLLAQAVIPSLLATNHIKIGVNKVRPLLYVAALVCLMATIYVVARLWLPTLDVIYDIYPKRLL